MIDDTQLLAFTQWAKDVKSMEPTITNVVLIQTTSPDDITDTCYGLMFVDQDVNQTDEHCDQCMEEILPLRFRGDQNFPYTHACMEVGTIKYDKIKSGEIKLPDNIKIIKQLDV